MSERTESLSDVVGTRLRTHKIRVEIVAGPRAGEVVELDGPEAIVGSGQDAQLTLADPTVSRDHLLLRVEDDGVRIVDRGSRNGTLVDGLRVRDAYARPDSTITLGNASLRLRLSPDTIELPLSTRTSFGGLIGRSVAMRRLFSLLEVVAPTDNTLLAEGETGTGKELVAEAVHENSPRVAGPFVVFDCSAVSSSLVESELFGHVRGAFTGAVQDRIGAFEAADGGTLFLDEIGELPLDLQPKLLRALERGEIRRVGATATTRIDTRIVAATNRTLAHEVESGRFREDLYYRLNVVHLRVPPLRERAEDIPLLAEHFAAQMRRGATLPVETLRAWKAQAWPGNVRELRNAVTRTLSFGASTGASGEAEPVAGTTPIDLAVPYKAAADRRAAEFQRAYVVEALRATGGNVTRAAELAGVDRKFIQRAITRFGLREGD